MSYRTREILLGAFMFLVMLAGMAAIVASCRNEMEALGWREVSE